MWVMILGLLLFLGAHLLPEVPATRDRLCARLGERPYRGLFSVVAIVGLVLVIWGYGLWRAAGPAVLYVPPLWMRHLTLLLMVPVFVLLVAAYAPGRIKRAVRHPMILAVKIWAFAHLLANGDAASLVLFASLLAWGVLDRISLKRRERAGLVAVETGGPVSNDAIAVVAGLVLYALFVWKLHEWLIGAPLI